MNQHESRNSAVKALVGVLRYIVDCAARADDNVVDLVTEDKMVGYVADQLMRIRAVAVSGQALLMTLSDQAHADVEAVCCAHHDRIKVERRLRQLDHNVDTGKLYGDPVEDLYAGDTVHDLPENFSTYGAICPNCRAAKPGEQLSGEKGVLACTACETRFQWWADQLPIGKCWNTMLLVKEGKRP